MLNGEYAAFPSLPQALLGLPSVKLRTGLEYPAGFSGVVSDFQQSECDGGFLEGLFRLLRQWQSWFSSRRPHFAFGITLNRLILPSFQLRYLR